MIIMLVLVVIWFGDGHGKYDGCEGTVWCYGSINDADDDSIGVGNAQ